MTQPRTALIPVPTDDRATRIAAYIGQIEGLLTTLRAELLALAQQPAPAPRP